MHEMSLAGGILRVVEQAAAREHFRRVKSLRLEAGALAGVEVRALRFALEAIAPGTCLEGATVDIDEPPASAWCLGCDSSVSIRERTQACPRCGGYRLQPTGGTELRVVEMIVHNDD
jgi:hydrogenase nickel incorporation protein HypA/HybF